MSRADDMRAAFDRGFASAPAPVKRPDLELLRIALAGESYALALADISSIHVDPKITRLPATRPELVGVIAVRGAIVPVYDLRALLGLATTTAARWVVIARGLAFAFDAFLGHLGLDAAPLPTTTPLMRGIVDHDGTHIPIIDLAGLIAARLEEQR